MAARLPAEEALVKDVLNLLSDSDKDDVVCGLMQTPGNDLLKLWDDLRFIFIDILVHGKVTDEEEGYIKDIWISFGNEAAISRKISEKESYQVLFRKSLRESDQLNEALNTSSIKEAFKNDVI